MKIAVVVGDMNPRQQVVIDTMIADGHEIVYVDKDDPYGGIAPDICIVDEYSKEINAMFDSYELPKNVVMQRPKWKVKTRPQKPYYRQKEKY